MSRIVIERRDFNLERIFLCTYVTEKRSLPSILLFFLAIHLHLFSLQFLFFDFPFLLPTCFAAFLPNFLLSSYHAIDFPFFVLFFLHFYLLSFLLSFSFLSFLTINLSFFFLIYLLYFLLSCLLYFSAIDPPFFLVFFFTYFFPIFPSVLSPFLSSSSSSFLFPDIPPSLPAFYSFSSLSSWSVLSVSTTLHFSSLISSLSRNLTLRSISHQSPPACQLFLTLLSASRLRSFTNFLHAIDQPTADEHKAWVCATIILPHNGSSSEISFP